MAPPQSSRVEEPSAKKARPDATLAEQHAFLNFAKDFKFREVLDLAKRTPVLVNCQPGNRWSAVMQAAFSGDSIAVNALFAAKADLNATANGKSVFDVIGESDAPMKEDMQKLITALLDGVDSSSSGARRIAEEASAASAAAEAEADADARAVEAEAEVWTH